MKHLAFVLVLFVGLDRPTQSSTHYIMFTVGSISVPSNVLSQSNRGLQGRRGDDGYTLRMHRARSVVLTSGELVEIRAAQRTFEGAYIRTAIGQFSFSLIVLKIFTAEFYSIGALFAVYGMGVLFTSLFRRHEGELAHSIQAGFSNGAQATSNSSPRWARMGCTARSSGPAGMWCRC